MIHGLFYCPVRIYYAISNSKCRTNLSRIDKAYVFVTTCTTEEVKITIVCSNAVLLLNSQ
jgi:hypothetical protein